jgi:hypothetical protein
MGLILRSTTSANSGNTVTIKGSALTYAEGDGNFAYLLTNMSGSNISITGSTGVLGNLNVSGTFTLLGLSNSNGPDVIMYNTSTGQFFYQGTGSFTAGTASFVTSSNVRGPFGVNSILSASYASGSTSASYALSASQATSASYALSATNVPTPILIATGSVTASVNVDTTSFQVTSGSNTLLSISNIGGTVISGSLIVVSGSTEFQVLGTGVKMGNSGSDIHTVTGSLSVDSTLYVTQSKVGVGTGIIAPANTLQTNGGITVGQSGSNMNQSINFIRGSDGATTAGISTFNGVIQIGGANMSFVDIYASNTQVARFNEPTAAPGTPALNLKGPLFVSGSGIAATLDYMLNVRGSGVSGSFNANNILITSGSHTILPQVSSSLDFTNDTNAAAGGVPLGGLYRNGNAIQIRLV